MVKDRIVRFYLEEPLRKSAQRGEHNFIALITEVLKKSLFRVEYVPFPTTDHPPNDYALCHMQNPPNDRGLTFRRAYYYPFWQIDAVAQRWQWDVATADFDPDTAPPEAQRFYRFWQKRLFGEATEQARRDGFIYVPLQGHLDRQRTFQSCTPLEMISHCIAHAQGREILATLHPNQAYSAAELAKLSALARRHSNLTIAKGDMERYLQGCDFVVTQNSGVAFSGYFFGKPALLFGKIDFHHIAEIADLSRLDQSFARVASLEPDFAAYIWWFWQAQSINAGREDAGDKIARRLHRFGWPIDLVGNKKGA